MKTYIITGASKGLGSALAALSLKTGNHCVIIARTVNERFKKMAEQTGAILTYITADLSETHELESLFERILPIIRSSDEIYLINNAGSVNPINRVGQINSEELERIIRLNFIAPSILVNDFLKYTNDMDKRKVIVNISSGAAKNPYEGWGAYCSTKAGLEMLTRVTGIEQQREKYPTTVVSFSPGIMDTGMQAVIRSTDEKDFADSNRFQEFKDKGMLRTPEFVAEVLMKLLEKKELENGKFYDIKELI